MHKTLRNLEKVAVWLERSKINLKDKVSIPCDIGLGWLYIKRILTFFPCLLVDHG